MKRIIATVLLAVLLIGALPVFAAQEDSQKMQEVLLIVKGKIEVPEALSEFSGDVSEYKEKKTYRFEWSTPEYDEYISVSSDDKGRIVSYRTSHYENSDKKISDVSKAELIAFAESFLRTIVPEAFVSDSDLLVYDEDAYFASGNLSYTLGFVRQKDGIPVKDNEASVNLYVKDGEIQVRSMNINFAYDVQFEAPGADLSDFAAKYKELFPVELIYRDEYNPFAKWNEPRSMPVLIYRIKDENIGYMESSTGEILTEDASDDYYYKEFSASDSVANMESAKGESLTPQEIAELENIEGLLSVDEIEKSVRSLPYIDFPEELLLERSSLYKDNLGEYYYSLSYRNDEGSAYRYFSVRANAEDGKILSLSGNGAIPYKYDDNEKELSEVEKQVAEQKITEFLNAVAKEEFAGCERESSNAYRDDFSESFVRIVNGVKYVDNGIYVTFDTENNIITNYSLDFTEGDFKDPNNAIGEAAAYEEILEYAPIVPVYIRNNGVYKKVFTLDKRNIAVDAISGEVLNKEESKNYTYSDISGHWVEEAAFKLAEIQVGLPGGKLNPEQKVTQEAFLRLIASAIWGYYYADDSTESLYDSLIGAGILTETEKAPESQVKREDAFVYVVRMAGYEKIAKLKDIYKVNYNDQATLSEEKLGYAAILSGLGVICGDGGSLRPQDAVTNAEAVVLAYKYLLSL